MLGWICYMIAILMIAVEPTQVLWMVPFAVGAILHWKYWGVGIVAFLVGAGWKKPF